jgi:hypothetical protein
MRAEKDAILYLQTGSAPYPFYNGVVGPMAYQPEAVRSGTAAQPLSRASHPPDWPPLQLGRLLSGSKASQVF